MQRFGWQGRDLEAGNRRSGASALPRPSEIDTEGLAVPGPSLFGGVS